MKTRTPTTSQVITALEVALNEVLGLDGEHWGQWEYKSVDEEFDYRCCAVGALFLASKSYLLSNPLNRRMVLALAEQLPEPFKASSEFPTIDHAITQFNDAEETTWEDVKQVFERAIQHLREDS